MNFTWQDVAMFAITAGFVGFHSWLSRAYRKKISIKSQSTTVKAETLEDVTKVLEQYRINALHDV
jgi:hypothetical protein